jgi:hypothetical protein
MSAKSFTQLSSSAALSHRGVQQHTINSGDASSIQRYRVIESQNLYGTRPFAASSSSSSQAAINAVVQSSSEYFRPVSSKSGASALTTVIRKEDSSINITQYVREH